jgi:uncharacterized protein (DUF433 family)
MPHDPEYRYIGRGLYSLSDAERLTRIPRQRIRRWMEGYYYVCGSNRRFSRPIVRSDLSREVGELALTFADLMEIRFLDKFRHMGVSWRSIRIAAERVGEVINSTHPFSTKRFKSDGHTILAEIADREQDDQLLDLVRDQWEIPKIVARYLSVGVEFNDLDEPRLWRPEKHLRVVVDPMRSFGAPIVMDGSVQTRVLAAAAKAERSQRAAASMYRVPLRAVHDAVKFERRFAA